MRKLVICLLSVFITLTLSCCAEEEKPPEKKSEPSEKVKETHHQVTIDGKQISYKAVAGTQLLKDDDGKTKASIFYIAYLKEGVKDPTDRPITFCFNGGPGSSSIWLHMGVFGPRKVSLDDLGEAYPPYRSEPNPHSILDLTDIVFIDPVSTGYSRAAPGEDAKQFHGVEEDIQSVGEFIRLFVTRNNRWQSSKFVAGESYGTTRAASLVGHMHDEHNMYFNGALLISTVLNFQTLYGFQRGNDLPYVLYLPTYTATAWYHKRLQKDLQKKDLQAVLKESQDFALNEYSVALLKGDKLPEKERKKITAVLSRYTGLEPKFIERANNRINIFRFVKELLRDENRTIGRFDGRFKGIDHDACGEHFENDPSADIIFGAFTAAFNHYVRDQLQWEEDAKYEVLTNKVRPWNYGKATNQYLYVGDTLREAMSRNPHLKVFVGNGYYDLATPYFATDYTINHLGLDPALQKHITMKDYQGGHMMYTYKPTLIKMKKDIAEFYKQTLQTN